MRSSRVTTKDMALKRYPSIQKQVRPGIPVGTYIPAAANALFVGDNRKGTPAEFIDAELERLSQLGSTWAPALRAAKIMVTARDDRGLTQVIDLCASSAARGDAYSQYLLAWAYLLVGRRREAAEFLRKSSLQLFPPAVLDSALFFWNGWGTERVVFEKIERTLKIADRTGHYGALMLRARIYCSGKLGFFRLLVGALLLPFALLRYAYGMWARPYSVLAFTLNRPSTFVAALKRAG
jgi:hypothetical protein